MELKINSLKKEDKNFPQNLKKLSDCPNIIYVAGNEKILNEFSIAVIGARRCTIEGEQITKQISEVLAENGINIVSGLAYGIDSIAYKSSLNKAGKPIAVLGYGINYLSKNDKERLIENIISSGGAIISEYPPDSPPSKWKFHNRNRIIAALSKGILVIEARENSGSLITIDYGKKLGKDIFVVPGSVLNENYIGSNSLIVAGEKCIRNAGDILKYYSKCITHETIKKIDVPKELMKVYDCLDKRGKTIDELCIELNMPAQEIMAHLTLLELNGCIFRHASGTFIR